MKHMGMTVAVLAVMMTAGVGAAESLNILYHGSPTVRIRALSSDAAIVHAADEFVAYVNALLRRTDYDAGSGHCTLNLALAGNGTCYRADELMATNGHSRATLGDEGFLLAHDRGRAYMLCAYTGKGVLNGMYKLLEKSFGVVAPRPSAGLDFPDRINAAESVTLPYSEKPAFTRRGMSISCQKQHHPDFPTWTWMARANLNARSMGMNTYFTTGWGKDKFGFVDALGGHSFQTWIPAREYYKTHPEYFALIDGKRVAAEHGAQISLGNPEVIDLIVEKILAYKKLHPELRQIPFGYNDSGSNPKNPFGWSEDPKDLAMDSPNDFPKAGSKRPRTFTTRYIKAANQIIARINKVYPDVKLMVYAYHFVMLQPPDCEIHPNLIIEFAPLYKCCQHPMNDPNCPRNRLFNEFLAKWAARTKNVYVRDYFNSSCWHFPLMSLHNIASEMKYYRDLGLAGIQPETFADGPNGGNEGGCNLPGTVRDNLRYEQFWEASGIHQFAMARLAWNPDEPMKDIVELYCRSYYGKAAGPHLAKMFLTMDENVYRASHPGEKSTSGQEGDWINRGDWCLCWNWRPSLIGWTRRLFGVNDGRKVQDAAQPMLEALYAAHFAAGDTGNRLIKNRVAAAFEQMRIYLLSQGCEIDTFAMHNRKKPPRLSVIGREKVDQD